MKFELVEIVTKDKLVHQGIYCAPSIPHKKAILWVHGLTGRFYGDVALMNIFADICHASGIGFAAFNNRGHDYMAGAHRIDSSRESGYVYETVGASVENFSECVHDIDAAISFLVHKGFEQVVLAGHSSGANKVCYYAAAIQDPRVIGVVLAGPMSDRYGSEIDGSVKKHLKAMQLKIQSYKGDELVSGVEFFPLTPKRWLSLVSAGSPEDVFNYRDSSGALAIYSRILLPLLVIFSGNDEHADRPITELQKAFNSHAHSSNYQSLIIADTDHGFTGKEKEFVTSVVDWAVSL